MGALEPSVLEHLFALIETRKGGDAVHSYTAQLLAAGPERIGAKLVEEAAETAEAAMIEAPERAKRVSAESADLLYHLLVLWADAGVTPKDVWAELARRQGMSGLAEKASRE
ncbi:MAG: phosphoribosyl-ATP diphosphatase [Rhodospirillales bacterium]|nr:phosphoribosyl-ATP diphosphatase [Rhodospirillales bacterium]